MSTWTHDGPSWTHDGPSGSVRESSYFQGVRGERPDAACRLVHPVRRRSVAIRLQFPASGRAYPHSASGMSEWGGPTTGSGSTEPRPTAWRRTTLATFVTP